MARNDGTATTLDGGFVARVAAGMGAFVTAFRGGNSWFGPGQPLPPALDEQQAVEAGVAGRQTDYITGLNAHTRPRSTETISFETLRTLADNFDLLRLVIETRKDQLCSKPWSVEYRDKAKKHDARCDAAEALLRRPDRENDWETWLRMLLEDLFVLDAPAVYVRRTLGGQIYSFEPIDGATIKRVVDNTGRTPMEGPAYQQVIKGVPAVDYTPNELIYRPRNRRTHKIYGYGPVEQMINIVDQSLRRQRMTTEYFTGGTVPDALAGVPESWTIDQIQAFQNYWDGLLASEDGVTVERRRLKFVPGEIAKNFVATKQAPLKDMFDEWLARIVCYCFSIDPTPFVAQVNRSVADTTREQSLSEGMAPLQSWVCGVVGTMLEMAGFGDLTLAWQEGEIVDPIKRQTVLCGYVTAKVMHPDEARERLGLPPLTPEQKADMTPPPPPALGGPQPSEGGQGAEPGSKLGDAPGGQDGQQDPPAKAEKALQPIEVHAHITVPAPEVVVDVGATTIHAHMGDRTETHTIDRAASAQD